MATAILFESSGGQTNKFAYAPDLRFALGEPGTWKFKPAMRKGKPVPMKVTVQVNFNLT